MLRNLVISLLAVVAIEPLAAQQSVAPPAPSNPQIDFAGHVALVTEVESYRRNRLVNLPRFRTMAAQQDVLLLDARSAEAFGLGHIDGAVNLPLPDFAPDSLAQLIGADRTRPILIYCNNNFSNNIAPVVRKLLTVALNIQTMTNLYGYGYRNIYELGEVVDLNDPAVGWVNSETSAD